MNEFWINQKVPMVMASCAHRLDHAPELFQFQGIFNHLMTLVPLLDSLIRMPFKIRVFKGPPPDTSAKSHKQVLTITYWGDQRTQLCQWYSHHNKKLTLSLACRHSTLALILGGLPTVGSPLRHGFCNCGFESFGPIFVIFEWDQSKVNGMVVDGGRCPGRHL